MENVVHEIPKLWHEGPNYAADAIVITDEADPSLLLIQRSDTREWALPGGFVDTNELPSSAARRELCEEATVSLRAEGELVYQGPVIDRRNTDTSWIETSAYVFRIPHEIPVNGSDDAADATWFPLAALPALYGSHAELVAYALDHIENAPHLQPAIETLQSGEANRQDVNGGHMVYSKQLLTTKSGATYFMKRHDDELFTDAERAAHSKYYLKKEAAVLSHLRIQGFLHIPRSSTLHEDNTLLMEAFQPGDGWYWRAPQEELQQYIEDCLGMFQSLSRTQQLPTKYQEIRPSFETFIHEGWEAIDNATLKPTLERLSLQLHDTSQPIAHDLIHSLVELQEVASKTPQPLLSSHCHHDARQANIAWHPERGARLVDWGWADMGARESDETNLLIDLHKSGHDISAFRNYINRDHCLRLMGFWLHQAGLPPHGDSELARIHQLASAVSAYDLLR